MKKKIMTLLLVLTLCSGLLTACGGSAKDTAASAPAASAPMMDAEAPVTKEENGFSSSTTASGADFSAIRENAKLILRAEVEAEATDFTGSDSAIQQLTAEAGGYIESSATGGSIGYRWANYTLRVPQEQFEAFLKRIGTTCHVTYVSRESEDVTENYYDTEARLATLTTKQDRLLVLLEKAEVMEDIIALETALAEVNYEIEMLTGTLRHYDSLVGFSTIHLNLNEVRDLTAMQETPSFGSELKQALKQGTQEFIDFFQGLLLLLAVCWPFLVLLAMIFVLVVLLLRRLKSKCKIRTDLFKRNNNNTDDTE